MFSKILLITTLLLSSTSLHSETLPIEHFNHMPMLQQPTISPNGKYLAGIYNSNDKTQVVVAPFGTQNLSALVSLGGEQYRIEDVTWANDERLLVNVSQPYEYERLRLRTTHVFSADIEGKNVFEMRRSIQARRETNKTDLDFYAFTTFDKLSVTFVSFVLAIFDDDISA